MGMLRNFCNHSILNVGDWTLYSNRTNLQINTLYKKYIQSSILLLVHATSTDRDVSSSCSVLLYRHFRYDGPDKVIVVYLFVQTNWEWFATLAHHAINLAAKSGDE